jgi:hypothetical protein
LLQALWAPEAWNFPLLQLVHVADFEAGEYLPATHGEQDENGAVEVYPAAQSEHPLAVAPELCPATHGVQLADAHDAAYVPAGHPAHAWKGDDDV